MALADRLRFRRALYGTALRSALAHRGAFWMNVSFMFANDVIWFSVWLLFYARFPSIGGFAFADMALLQGLLATAFGAGVVFAGGVRELARTIDEGGIEAFLLQPRPVLGHVAGTRVDASGVGDLLYGLATLAVFADLGGLSWAFVPAALLAATVVFVSFNVIVHSLAFWAGSFHPFARQLNEILITVSGYPRSIHGGVMRALLFVVVPAGLLTWLPTDLVRAPSAVGLAATLGGALGIALVARAVFRAGLRRYEAGSRFGATL